MTHKMAFDSRGWKMATVCGTPSGHGTTISRFDRHITCPKCLEYKGYRIEENPA